MPVYILGDQVLVNGDSVATSEDCCCGEGGACCDEDDVCYIAGSQSECEAVGGTYLGDGSTCGPVDCTCCPILARFNTITFSGEIIGCTGGTITLPLKIWGRVVPPPGCDLSLYEWSTDSNCGCQFNAQNCFPFTESDFIAIDQTGDCDDLNYGSCLLAAQFFCNDGTVLLSGSAVPPCCTETGIDTTSHGPYDITGGGLDVTYPSDTNPAIRFHYNITLS